MMKNKKIDNKATSSGSSAVIVDGKLILTFLEAMTPIVWQMDLDQAKSSALEVVEDKKKKTFSLMLRNNKGEAAEVAPFETKEQAVNALMITSNALQEGQGKIRPQTVMQMPYAQMQNIPMNSHAEKGSSNKTGGFLAIGLIIILMLIWLFSIPREGQNFMVDQEQKVSGSMVGGASVKTGVPVSADDFLNGQ